MHRGDDNLTVWGDSMAKNKEKSIKQMTDFFDYAINEFPDFINDVVEQRGDSLEWHLRAVTPVDTGMTKEKWGHYTCHGNGHSSVTITNSNVVDGANVAVLIDRGHATRNGGWVYGYPFIGEGEEEECKFIEREIIGKINSQ